MNSSNAVTPFSSLVPFVAILITPRGDVGADAPAALAASVGGGLHDLGLGQDDGDAVHELSRVLRELGLA